MTDTFEKQKEANDLRKQQRYDEALNIYNFLRDERKNKYDGAGLLHCLRKLERYDEAVPLANELVAEFPEFGWTRTEAIWTYISGELNQLEDNTSLYIVVQVAQKILDLDPEPLPKKLTVFRVLKTGKEANKWQIVSEWVDLLDPHQLDEEVIKNPQGKGNWSDKSLWYNYKVKSLIETEQFDKALEITKSITGTFPRLDKFFLRLRALAHKGLGELQEAETIYSNLCGSRKPASYILSEYASVLWELDKTNEALKCMYEAAKSNPNLDYQVSLFENIGKLCQEMQKDSEALDHFLLSKLIRENNSWSVSEHLLMEIEKLIDDSGDTSSITLTEAKIRCKQHWNSLVGTSNTPQGYSERQTSRKNLTGAVILGNPGRPYCFIKSNANESFFCSKSDLPSKIKNGDRVEFDAVPSFDKKKQQKSWRASNVRLA